LKYNLITFSSKSANTVSFDQFSQRVCEGRELQQLMKEVILTVEGGGGRRASGSAGPTNVRSTVLVVKNGARVTAKGREKSCDSISRLIAAFGA